MYINFGIYIITFILTVMFRKKEILVTIINSIILLLTIQNHNILQSQTAIIAGSGFALLEYICIKYFDMWKYNVTNYIIPTWLPLIWILTSFFILDLHELIKKLFIS